MEIRSWDDLTDYEKEKVRRNITTAFTWNKPVTQEDVEKLLIESIMKELGNSKMSSSGYVYVICDKEQEDIDKGIVDIVYYRNYLVNVYADDPGQQFYCIIDGEEYTFGAYNLNYIDDIIYIIDDKLDSIYKFEEPFFGAELKYYQQYGCRDIVLYYRCRELKVFLQGKDHKLTEEEIEKLIIRSKEILSKFQENKDTDTYLEL